MLLPHPTLASLGHLLPGGEKRWAATSQISSLLGERSARSRCSRRCASVSVLIGSRIATVPASVSSYPAEACQLHLFVILPCAQRNDRPTCSRARRRSRRSCRLWWDGERFGRHAPGVDAKRGVLGGGPPIQKREEATGAEFRCDRAAVKPADPPPMTAIVFALMSVRHVRLLAAIISLMRPAFSLPDPDRLWLLPPFGRAPLHRLRG